MSIGQKLALLVLCLGIGFAPGLVGSQFAPGGWYEALDKPPLTPPGWVFPVVWTALYAAIGASLYLYLTAPRRPIPRAPIVAFGLQLIANAAWSWLFFGLERPGLALIDIVGLVALVAFTAYTFGRRRRIAGALLWPYLLWIGFATYLNAGIVLLNL